MLGVWIVICDKWFGGWEICIVILWLFIDRGYRES